jgi:hypothetical protein
MSARVGGHMPVLVRKDQTLMTVLCLDWLEG